MCSTVNSNPSRWGDTQKHDILHTLLAFAFPLTEEFLNSVKTIVTSQKSACGPLAYG